MNAPVHAAASAEEQRPSPSAPLDVALLWGLLVVVACATWATSARLSQLDAWKSEPARYWASGVPMMTTLDAYYSLRLARLHAAGTFVPHGPAPARHYSRPEQGSPGEWYVQREPKSMPLLSRAIAWASVFTAGDIDRAGLLLPPWLSSLFMIPLFLCCWRLGVPAAGIMGGLVGTFCFEYYRRTSIGWVDTDALNLFFPWLAAFCILTMSASQRRDRLLLQAAATGGVLYVYGLWYPKPGIAAMFALAMTLHLALAGVAWRRCAACLAVLVVFANPMQFAGAIVSVEEFAARYLSGSQTRAVDTTALQLPNVWSTVLEAAPQSRADAMRSALGRMDVALVGLAGFAGLAAWRWRAMAALGPLILLGALALVSSRRFSLYLAPLIGIGWGAIVGTVVHASWRRIVGDGSPDLAGPAARTRWGRIRGHLRGPAGPALASCLASVAVFAVWFLPLTGRHYVPLPAVPAPVSADLVTLDARLPPNARLWTWWDYGFAIVDKTRFGVYHDGSAQYTAQTNLIARSFVAADQQTMHKLIGFVDREGNPGINRIARIAAGFDDLVERIPLHRHTGTDAVPIFVLITPDMLAKYPSLAHLGGTSRIDDASAVGMRLLDCRRIVDDRLECAHGTADLRTGVLGGRWPATDGRQLPTLGRALVVEGGRVVRQRDYGGQGELTLQLQFAGGAIQAVYLLDEAAYRSNLNQMFVLGNYDRALFEEVWNGFPHTRVFRFLGRDAEGLTAPSVYRRAD